MTAGSVASTNNGKIINDRTSVDGNSETIGQIIENRRIILPKYGCSVVNVTISSFWGSMKIKPLSDVLKQTIVWRASGNSIVTYPHLYPSLRALFLKSLAKLMQV